jgi:hypothetical protein
VERVALQAQEMKRVVVNERYCRYYLRRQGPDDAREL